MQTTGNKRILNLEGEYNFQNNKKNSGIENIYSCFNKYDFQNKNPGFKMSNMTQLGAKLGWSIYLGMGQYGFDVQTKLASSGALIVMGMISDCFGWNPQPNVAYAIEFTISIAPYFFYPTSILPTITLIPQLLILFEGFNFKWHGLTTITQAGLAFYNLTNFDINNYLNITNYITLGIYAATTFLAKWDYRNGLKMKNDEMLRTKHKLEAENFELKKKITSLEEANSQGDSGYKQLNEQLKAKQGEVVELKKNIKIQQEKYEKLGAVPDKRL